MCQGIAKFYIRIAHIYAAILKTINPYYVFSDQQGKQKIPLLQYAKLPRHVEKKLKKPVFSSNQTLIWDAIRSVGYNSFIEGYGSLFKNN